MPEILSSTPYSLSWLLCASAFACALLTILWFMRPMIKVGSFKTRDVSPATADAPKVSVIVCTENREEELLAYLDSLVCQGYPDYEIIVVSESTSESTEILSECCSRRYSNVYVTFVPPESHSLSRRKLALTLGMKAAKGEIVVTTVSNAEIPSPSWLSELTAVFRMEGSAEVSLGYSHLDFSKMKGAGRWYKEFDSVMTDARWLGFALLNKPYRGDGFNLAMRRDLFFRHKGYSRSLALLNGDDDVFINEVSDGDNTQPTLNPESILSIDWGESSSRIWSMRKEQYDYTSHWLPRAPFVNAGIFSAMQWIIPLLCAGAILAPLMKLIKTLTFDVMTLCAVIAPVLIWELFLLCEILIYRRAASRMQSTRLWWALPWFMLARPIVNFLFRLNHRGSNNTTFI
ncbi:MAG: glycosyltransferase [Muribaculaceae bacterium]|nr:glycosyltransferase [Muribaculaceae bacterium]